MNSMNAGQLSVLTEQARYKVFVINLKEDVKRKAGIERQLSAAGLQAEIVEAVNGRELSEARLAEVAYDHANCGLTKGEIGCALSHIKIYRSMVAESIPLALVLEDDAVLRPQARDVLEEIAFRDRDSKPAVYLLSHVTDYLPLTKRALETCALYNMYRGYGAHGYILNLAAAEKLGDFLYPVIFPADRWEDFKLLVPMDIYCVVPHVIETGDPGKESSWLEKERHALKRQRGIYKKNMVRKKFPLAVFHKLVYRSLVRLFSKKNT